MIYDWFAQAKSSDLFAVEGGNWKLMEALLAESGAKLSLNTRIRTVAKQSDADGHRWQLVDTNGTRTACDAVVVALPLHQRNTVRFSLPGFNASALEPSALRTSLGDAGAAGAGTAEGSQPEGRRFVTPFQRTVTTLVAGRLNPEYFGSEFFYSPAHFVLGCTTLALLYACTCLDDTSAVGSGGDRGVRLRACCLAVPWAALALSTVIGYAVQENLVLSLHGCGRFDRTFSVPDIILTTEHPAAYAPWFAAVLIIFRPLFHH